MTSLSEELVMEKLRDVIDPEVSLNIVDLGLVYGVTLNEGSIEVRMTLTTRGCPMSAYMTEQVTTTLSALDGVRNVKVELVWNPPWTPSRITPEAMEILRAGRPY